MVTTSYPRFPGDLTGTFLEPIAHGVANRGHTVHVVAPWHPLVQRPPQEGNVHFHFYKYAPIKSLNVFGYASSLKADTSMRSAAYLATPFALTAASMVTRRIVRTFGATVIHAHWVVPNGFIASLVSGTLPLVVSLHGSDVYVAERHKLAKTAAKHTFRRANWVTACSENLRARATKMGASENRSEVVPYGVDIERFTRNDAVRHKLRGANKIPDGGKVVLAVGRLVRKKGFEYLIDSIATLRSQHPKLRLVFAGSGDLEVELRERVRVSGLEKQTIWLGAISQDHVANWLSASDIMVVPSVKDDSGNMDGLPNVLLEGLASTTPVITTPTGGISSVAHDGKNALVVPERNSVQIAEAISLLLKDPSLGATLGQNAREHVRLHHSWTNVAKRFEASYQRAALDIT